MNTAEHNKKLKEKILAGTKAKDDEKKPDPSNPVQKRIDRNRRNRNQK